MSEVISHVSTTAENPSGFARRVEFANDWLTQHYWLLVPPIILGAALKQGIDIYAFDERTATFEQAAPYIPAVPPSYRPWKAVIAHYLPGFSLAATSYVLVAMALLLVAVLVLAVMCRKKFPRDLQLLAFSSLVLGSTGTVLFTLMGMYDTFFIVGACLFVWTRAGKSPLTLVGLALMLWANPAQSLAGCVCLVLLALTPEFGKYRTRAIAGACIAAALELGESIIPASGPIQEHLLQARQSLSFTLATAPLRYLTIYGITITLVVLAVLAAARWALVLRLIALIVIPVGVVTVTLDGTRVGVTTVSCCMFALMIWVVPRLEFWMKRTSIPAIALIFLVAVVPTPNAHWNGVKTPWAAVVSVIQSF
ncbi:MAG: hypothetical protein KGR25_09870, partial [Chloroflexi bacterium]|nr:hypothetical protein [Chloroflexota bacterium]